MQEKVDGSRSPYRTDWEASAQWSYQDEKNLHWQEWGFISADETEYQRNRRQEAEKRVASLDRRVAAGKLSGIEAVVIVKELLRNTRSPSKRPVFEAWLERTTDA